MTKKHMNKLVNKLCNVALMGIFPFHKHNNNAKDELQKHSNIK
jgi:hypothetical protein